MKKSNVLLFVIVVSTICNFVFNGEVEKLIFRINITILFVGYLILLQMEEKKSKNETN